MSRQSSVTSDSPQGAAPRNAPLRVLLVGGDAHFGDMLCRCDFGQRARVEQLHNFAQARRFLSQSPVDLLLVESELADGKGIDLARPLREKATPTQVLVLGKAASFDAAIDAMRKGADDYLVRPLSQRELGERIAQAAARFKIDNRRRRQVRRLRRTCQKLSAARQQVMQQVDVLCQDLVTAYQELANQMQQVVQASEYAGMIRQELDLEALLRKTLEFLLDKAGPTNAAIFLPSSEEDYGLGGYVNYDCDSGSPDVLLQHLADVLAPRMAECTELVHVTDNDAMRQWLADDWSYLADCHVMAIACRHDEEALAIIVLFRDGSQPFDGQTTETLLAMAPLLGDYLAKVIRVHHRHHPATAPESDAPNYDAGDYESEEEPDDDTGDEIPF